MKKQDALKLKPGDRVWVNLDAGEIEDVFHGGKLDIHPIERLKITEKITDLARTHALYGYVRAGDRLWDPPQTHHTKDEANRALTRALRTALRDNPQIGRLYRLAKKAGV